MLGRAIRAAANNAAMRRQETPVSLANPARSGAMQWERPNAIRLCPL